MPISLVAKTPVPLHLPNGGYCILFHDFTNGYSTSFFTDANKQRLYTKLDMSKIAQQRCLQYKIYSDRYSIEPDVVSAVPLIDKNSTEDDGSSISQPLFECNSPVATYVDEKGGANLLFWTNLMQGVSAFEKDQNGQYIYDASKILKINHNQMDSFTFSTGQITRALCSVHISFVYLYAETEISTEEKKTVRSLIPVASSPVVLHLIKADSPVLDFGTGGSDNGGSSGIRRHSHATNADGGFAFAVLHPGTSIPPGIPWKR